MTTDWINSVDRQLEKKGMLMIVWGWVMALHFMINYLLRAMVLSFQLEDFLNLLAYTLIPFGLFITAIYLIKKRTDEHRTQVRLVIYIWGTLLFTLMLINLTLAQALGHVNFELQHPIFMVVTGTAITITGRAIDQKMMMLGGVLFGVLGYSAAMFPLTQQLLFEAVGWVIAFILPGYLVYFHSTVSDQVE